ncbi:Protein O-glucosyltransferase 2 [Perkinsus chesapeaki]|uniref:Protein O-glucosyltransferase 2 n=1 Tax=Perkinsus chesapeaki TaxID=330153 RepID=A0A7J6N0H9_PERCH|nr:Protein O-glucosyltransferase 2 [Perkinsus chesapeaki]
MLYHIAASTNQECFPTSLGLTSEQCCHPKPFGDFNCWDTLAHTYSQCCIPVYLPSSDCLSRAQALGLGNAPWWVGLEACCRNPTAQECWRPETVTALRDHTTGEPLEGGHSLEYAKCCLGAIELLGPSEDFARGVRKALQPWRGYREVIGQMEEDDPHRCLYRIRSNIIWHCNFSEIHYWDITRAANIAIHTLAVVAPNGLPDVDLYVAGYELEPPNPSRGPYPHLLFVSRLAKAFSATRRQGIVLPVWALFGRLGWEIPLTLERTSVPWEKKLPILFWRGTFDGNRYSSGLVEKGAVWANVSFKEHFQRVFISGDDWQLYSRARLVLLSKTYPHLIDAKFTAVAETASARVQAEVRRLGLMAEGHVPIVDQVGHLGTRLALCCLQLRYRYHVDLDGSANSERFLWLAQTETTVFRVYPRPMYHYADTLGLEPWMDYVPIKEDLSDLVGKLMALEENKARAMALSMARKAKEWMTSLAAHRALLATIEEISKMQNRKWPPWLVDAFSVIYRRAERQIFTLWDEEGPEAIHDLGMDIAEELAASLRALTLRNVTRVLECNVGVIAGLHLLAKRLSLQSNAVADQRRAYRLLQLAMIFIFTLRNAVRIPAASEREWGTSKDEIVRSIHGLRLNLGSNVPTEVAVDHDLRVTGMRVGIVSICAYPEDSPMLLRRVTPRNREAYTARHGYSNLMHLERPMGAEVHVQHSKLWLMAEYVRSGQYDWLVWMDCDSIIMNMTRTIDSIVMQYTQKAAGHQQQSRVRVEEVVPDYSGLWQDSFQDGGSLIAITQQEEMLSLVAEQLPLGSWAQLVLPEGLVIKGSFGPEVALVGRYLAGEIRWSNGAIWRRIPQIGGCSCDLSLDQSYLVDYVLQLGRGCSAMCRGRSGMDKTARVRRRCTNDRCDVEIDDSIDVLITEEGWGLSSANWIIRGNSIWSQRLLMDAFHTAHHQLPLFGDQDALIWHLTMGSATDLKGRHTFHPRARVIPQGAINAYDALNAYYMACDAFSGPKGHLLVTFPGCRDPRACNPLFAVAYSYSIGDLQYNREDWAHVRVLGPGQRAVEMFEGGQDETGGGGIAETNNQRPVPIDDHGQCVYPEHMTFCMPSSRPSTRVIVSNDVNDRCRFMVSSSTGHSEVTSREAVEWAVALLRAVGLAQVDISDFRCLRDSPASSSSGRGASILHSACRLVTEDSSPQTCLANLGYPRLDELRLACSDGPSDVEAMRAVMWLVFNKSTGLRRKADGTWQPNMPRVLRILLGLNPRPLPVSARPSTTRPSSYVDSFHAVQQAVAEIDMLAHENASVVCALAKADYGTPASMPSGKAAGILNPKMVKSLDQYREEVSKLERLAACEVKFCEWLRSTTVYDCYGEKDSSKVGLGPGGIFDFFYSVPQSATTDSRRLSELISSDENSERSKGNRRTSLASLPGKRLLQPSQLDNIEELPLADAEASSSKKACLRQVDPVDGNEEKAAELRNEIGRLQEKIAWMTSKGVSGVDSGLRLADMQEELRQEREHSARLKVKYERLERRVEDSDRLQAELRAAREEAKAYRNQVTALEMKVAADDDHDRTLAALTKMNQELDQRATEATNETEGVRKVYEEKVATLKADMERLQATSEEAERKLEADIQERVAEAKTLSERMEEKEKAHAVEVEGMKRAMAEQRAKLEGDMEGLISELEELRKQSLTMKDSITVMERDHGEAVEALKRKVECAEEELAQARQALESSQADLAEMQGRVSKAEAMVEEKTASLEEAEGEIMKLREQQMASREEQMDGRKRRRVSEEGGDSAVTARVDQCTATEGAEWALLVNASSNTIAPSEEEPALLEGAQAQQEELREEVKRLTEAIEVYKGRVAKAREEGDRLEALLVEGKGRAELFMRQRDAERRGMQRMIDELEVEARKYRDGLVERETIEVEALAEAILGRATEAAVTMAVAREMGKASEGLRMTIEELRVRLGEEQRHRRCAEETNRDLVAEGERVEEQLRDAAKECSDLKAALAVSEEGREHMAMVNAEEAEALNRLDAVVRKLEEDKQATEACWGEEKDTLQEQIRELRARETELVEKTERLEEAMGVAKERLDAEIKEAEESAAAAAECHQDEREAYERQLQDLAEQMATLEASAKVIAEDLTRDVEKARFEGNEAHQCLVNQREAYEKIIADLEVRLQAAEEAFDEAQKGYAKSKAHVDAEIEIRKREVFEVIAAKEDVIRGLEDELKSSTLAKGNAMAEVKELQERLMEEKERYAELVHTHERHIEALERQMEQAKAGYEKHIDEVNNEMHEMQTDHEVEIARVGREAIIEHDELVESFNERMEELRRVIQERDAKIELLEKDSSALVDSLKEAARTEATRITEEYETKLEALEIELTNARYELAKAREEGDHRLREIANEFDKLITEKEAEVEEQLGQIQEIEQTKEAERAKKAEQVRAEMQSTIARLFEEKNELAEMLNNVKLEHERQLQEEASKASSDRAQLVVAHSALVADIKAQAQVSLDDAEDRVKNAVARADKAEAKLEEKMSKIGQSQVQTAGRIEELMSAVEDLTAQKSALEKQATSLRAELGRVKSSIGDAVRGAEKGWEVAIRNLVDLPERYKATYDDFLQAKVRIEELTRELAEGHKSQNHLEERIKRLQSGKLSSSDEKTEATARQLRYEIRQLKDQYADLATRNIDFKRMAAEARCEAIQSAKLIVTYKREKDAAVLEKEEALAGLRKSKTSAGPSPQPPPTAGLKSANISGKASTPLQQQQPKHRPTPSAMPMKSSLKKATLGDTSSPSATTKEATAASLTRALRQPPRQAAGNPRPPSPAPTKSKIGTKFLKLASPDDAKIQEKTSPTLKRKEPPPPTKKRVSMSPEECKQQ